MIIVAADRLRKVVALRKESVDRNCGVVCAVLGTAVALRKESVDRNCIELQLLLTKLRSLSARRAWIEILKQLLLKTLKAVALRKESVDRNSTYVILLPRCQVSLSARRAWIEILAVWAVEHAYQRRSPQGERG